MSAGWLILAVLALPAAAEETANSIMARVAQNQDRSQELRTAYIYHQSVLIRFRRGNRKLAREESSEYTVAPTAKGTHKELTRFEGKYISKGRTFVYDKPHFTYKDLDVDGELISELTEEMTNEKESRDGIARDMFPLTSSEQKKYVFRLEGRQAYRAREVYQVTFRPHPGREWDEDNMPWAGEVLVDAQQYQPVVVATHLAKGLPFVVRTLLGTNLKSLGFKLTYDDFGGVWFPVTYGGEFELRAVFFYKRLISMSMMNRGFQRANVESQLSFQLPK